MIYRVFVIVFAVLALVSPALAATADCPTLEHAKIEKLLAEAATCDDSMKLFEACQYGASGDVSFSEIVIKKCDGAFLGKLSKSAQRAYDRKLYACWHKYAKEHGTMFQSLAAFCAAGVAQTYARRAAAKKR